MSNTRIMRRQLKVLAARVVAFVILLGVVVSACGNDATANGAESVSADPAAVFGTYETPCGVVTVQTDYSGNYASAETYPVHDGESVANRSAVTVLSGGREVVGTYETPCGVVTVYSDASGRFDPFSFAGACDGIDWERNFADAQRDVMTFPVDVNRDGYISCSSDFELGS